jgi:hypothetical protein
MRPEAHLREALEKSEFESPAATEILTDRRGLMSSDEKQGPARTGGAAHQARYESVDNFIQFATNLSPGGMFISTRTPKPPGTEIVCAAPGR